MVPTVQQLFQWDSCLEDNYSHEIIPWLTWTQIWGASVASLNPVFMASPHPACCTSTDLPLWFYRRNSFSACSHMALRDFVFSRRLQEIDVNAMPTQTPHSKFLKCYSKDMNDITRGNVAGQKNKEDRKYCFVLNLLNFTSVRSRCLCRHKHASERCLIKWSMLDSSKCNW